MPNYPFPKTNCSSLLFLEKKNKKNKNKRKTPKSVFQNMNAGEIFIYAGKLFVPVLWWLSVLALITSYVNRANWSFKTRMAFYWFLAVVSLIFLLIAHCTDHPAVQHFAK